MGKNPGYLPKAAWTVGGLIDEQLLITWHCEKCRQSGPVDLLRIAQARGIDYCLVDKRSVCRAAACRGTVYFRYAPGPGTPSRHLQALRERQDAAVTIEGDRAIAEARRLYNAVAHRYGRLPLP